MRNSLRIVLLASVLAVCWQNLLSQDSASDFQLLSVHPANPQAGELFQMLVHTSPAVHSIHASIVTLSGNTLSGFKGFPVVFGGSTVWVISCVVAMTAAAPQYLVVISSSELAGKKIEHELVISPRSFLSETIAFDKSLSELRTVPDPRKSEESQALQKLLYHFDTTLPLGSSEIRYPLSTIRKTAFFGDRRVYVYENGSGDTATHNGVDFGGSKIPVQAPGSGTIVFAQSRIVTGNTVILQHAPGVYSLFYHLSEIAVAPGQFVKAGTYLGKTGSTGLATGPHLHWEIRCQGEAADPEDLMLNGLVDTGSLSKLLSAPVFP